MICAAIALWFTPSRDIAAARDKNSFLFIACIGLFYLCCRKNFIQTKLLQAYEFTVLFRPTTRYRIEPTKGIKMITSAQTILVALSAKFLFTRSIIAHSQSIPGNAANINRTISSCIPMPVINSKTFSLIR
jgi:hypothetical protein